MTWKGGSRVNAKKYCLSSTRKTLEAAALTGGVWTSGAAATSIRPNSLRGRCHILITLDCWNTQGGIYIYIATVNPKNNKVKFPSAYILVKTVQMCQTASLEECFKVLWSPSTFPLSSHIFFFFNYFQGTVGLERRGAGVWRGCLGRKHLTGNFQQTESICTPA